MHAHSLHVTRRQIALLHVIKRDNALSDKTYRDVLEEAAGVTTSKLLTQEGFDAALDLLDELGLEVPKRRPMTEFAKRAGRASPAQLRFIEGAGRQVFQTDQAFRHWMERFFGASDLRFLTPGKARGVIEALKSIRERNWGAASEHA